MVTIAYTAQLTLEYYLLVIEGFVMVILMISLLPWRDAYRVSKHASEQSMRLFLEGKRSWRL